jgi:hypothetical protein
MPTTTSFPSPITPAGWQTYADSEFAFRIAYPKSFTFKKEGIADPSFGWLVEFRAVDNAYLNGYPPGQVEIGIYAMDADTLTNWIAKHTGEFTPTNRSMYWKKTSNLHTAFNVGRPAISFDYEVLGFPVAVHATAFLQNASRVTVFIWWSNPSYASSIQTVAGQMLASYDG